MAKALVIELVPRPLWGLSLASIGRKGWWSQWNAIRSRELARASGKCEFCREPGHMIHEHWDYEDATRIQHLRGFSVSCDKCSLVHHFGRANVTGRTREALAQIAHVNGISEAEARLLAERAFEIWETRSSRTWSQDLGWLRLRVSDYGLSEADITKAEELLGQVTRKPPA